MFFGWLHNRKYDDVKLNAKPKPKEPKNPKPFLNMKSCRNAVVQTMTVAWLWALWRLRFRV